MTATAHLITDALDPEATYPVPSQAVFEDEDGFKADYIAADDLARMGRQLIEECSELHHLRDAQIVYLWKREGGSKNGQMVLGKCTKASGLVKYLAEATWVIWLAADHLAGLAFTVQQVRAACHHELCHAGERENKDGEFESAVVGHDCEMFAAEVKRFGLWREPLRTARNAFQQMAMFGGD